VHADIIEGFDALKDSMRCLPVRAQECAPSHLLIAPLNATMQGYLIFHRKKYRFHLSPLRTKDEEAADSCLDNTVKTLVAHKLLRHFWAKILFMSITCLVIQGFFLHFHLGDTSHETFWAYLAPFLIIEVLGQMLGQFYLLFWEFPHLVLFLLLSLSFPILVQTLRLLSPFCLAAHTRAHIVGSGIQH